MMSTWSTTTTKKTLSSMRSAHRWILWKSEPNKDPSKKNRKVPYYINGQRRQGTLDTQDDWDNLATYDDALDVIVDGAYSGLGFALGEDQEGGYWQGVDLDDIDKNSLTQIVDELPGYVEWSPSQKGVHSINYGEKLPSLGSNGTGVEFYASGRYFTVTNDIIRDGSLQDIGQVYHKLEAWHSKKVAPTGLALPSTGPLVQLAEEVTADIRSALAHLSAEDYDLWIKAGLALCSYQQGKGLWTEWSQKSLEQFNPIEAEAKWRSFKPGNTGVDYPSIFHWAKESGWLNPAKHVEGTQQADDSDLIALNPLPIGLGILDAVASIPPRPWIIQNLLLRGYVSAIFSPGGVGKSTLQLVLALSVATGRDLINQGIEEQTPVLVINNEDDQDEMLRRIGAIVMMYGITEEELEGNFYVQSGYGSPLMIASMSDKVVKLTPNVESMTEFCTEKSIGVIMIDPFISTHDIPENDNTLIDKVVHAYKRIARDTGAAICLVHHTKKTGNNSEHHAGDAESGRGASSLKDAARCIVTLARMSEETAEQIQMEPAEAQRHLRMDVGKLNFGLDDGQAKWFRMSSFQLPNGDWTGVPEAVDLSSEFSTAAPVAAPKWTGTKIAESLENIFNKKQSSERWSLIRAEFCLETGIGNTQSNEYINLISRDKSDPTRIHNGSYLVDYWTSKDEGVRAPIIVHRQEISE